MRMRSDWALSFLRNSIGGGGGNPLVDRRYLKLTFTDTHASGGVYAIAQLTLHETVGGPDVLAGSGATITASSVFSSPTNDPDKVADGNNSTWWASGSGGTQTLKIDWGAAAGKEIKEIGIKARNDGSFQQQPLVGSVAYSANDSSYTTDWNFPFLAMTFTGAGAYGLMKSRLPSLIPSTAPNHRIWGIKGNACPAGFLEFGKVELRATLGGSTLCTGGGTPLMVTSWRSDFPPSNAFDGVANQAVLATNFARGYSMWDFLEGNEIPIPAQVALKASAIPSRCYTDFDLFYMDGLDQTPVTVRNFTTPATWSASEVRTFNT